MLNKDMCGIAGYIGKKRIDEPIINRTLALMKNRGPDNQAYQRIQVGDGNVYLLHSRLSIIDLDKRSNQPFTIGQCTIIFNGEIYNYVELREDLEAKGERCTTDSDTEVLLRYYLLYGEDCVKYFEGMWSFAIYDSAKGKLFLSRDRFGEKPLYYLETGDGFYFGSEIKFLKSLSQQALSVNHDHLFRYLVNGYKSLYKTDEMFFKEIKELKCAMNMTITAGLQKTVCRYWEPKSSFVDMSLKEAIEGTRQRLLESMRIRLRSDVPLAFCLSGGVDSASLASIAAKKFKYDVVTFSIIDPDERYNEYDNIKATIDDLKCKHILINLSYDHTLSRLKDLIAYHDTPIATITYLVHSFISKAIAENGYRVAFSGTSADELFTGYYDHFNLHLYEMRNRPDYSRYLNDWQANTGNFVRNPYLKNAQLYFDNPGMREHIYLNNADFASYLKDGFKEEFIEQSYTDSLLRNRMLNELFHEVTPVILHEDDLNSMKYSIENRSPYLDSRLFEFAYSIPNEYVIQKGYGKFILREAMKGILNDQVRLDRQKKGFNASIKSIVDFSNKEDRAYLLDDSPVYDFVKKERIEELLSKDTFSNSYNKFLFNFINIKIFLELNAESTESQKVLSGKFREGVRE